MIRKFIYIIVALLLSTSYLAAQNKAETRFYEKTIAKPSVAAFDKFLKRYPKSVYAQDIIARKDTLLNITPYNEAQAREIFAAFLPEKALFVAFAKRSDAVDYIYGACVSASDIERGNWKVLTLKKETAIKGAASAKKKESGDIGTNSGIGAEDYSDWTIASSIELSSAYNLEGDSWVELCDSTKTYKIRGEEHYQFCYINRSANKAHLLAVSFCPRADEYHELCFSAKALSDGKLEGRIDFTPVAEPNSQAIRVLEAVLRSKDNLVFISNADYLSDESISWWLNANPLALSKANKLSINTIPEGSSLISLFEECKQKQNSAKYSAALIDVRGYTVIVVKEKKSGTYLLAWAETECVDHYRDRLLNNISFDDSNTLRLNYYHGKKTFKYKLNLASKSIVR